MTHSNQTNRKLLQMVTTLHERGYERLRVLPYMSPSGAYWRCEIGPAADGATGDRGVGHPRARYSSSNGADYFEWGDCSNCTVDELANRFEQSFPEILEASKGTDGDYARWFADMLKQTEPGGLIYAFADWEYDPSVMNVIGESAVESVPLPPV